MVSFLRYPYHLFNLIISFLFAMIFVYSACISPSGKFPVSSGCEGLPEVYCQSRGLQRAFSSLVRGRVDDAIAYNKHAIRVAIFFLWQILQRAVISVILMKTKINQHKLIGIDAVSSFIFLFFSFHPFIF